MQIAVKLGNDICGALYNAISYKQQYSFTFLIMRSAHMVTVHVQKYVLQTVN